MFQSSMGFFSYVAFLLILTGLLILLFETKAYKKAQRIKEEKVSRVMGWINLSLGAFAFLGYWVYSSFIL